MFVQLQVPDADLKLLSFQAHRNASEYIPLILLFIALLEASGSTSRALHLYGDFAALMTMHPTQCWHCAQVIAWDLLVYFPDEIREEALAATSLDSPSSIAWLLSALA